MDNNNSGDQSPSKAGPAIGIVIIILIIFIGGLYFWGQMVDQNERATLTPEEILSQPTPDADALRLQSTSDEVNLINQDLQATNLSDLDKELTDINLELNGI